MLAQLRAVLTNKRNFYRFAIRSWASVVRSFCYSWATCFFCDLEYWPWHLNLAWVMWSCMRIPDVRVKSHVVEKLSSTHTHTDTHRAECFTWTTKVVCNKDYGW